MAARNFVEVDCRLAAVAVASRMVAVVVVGNKMEEVVVEEVDSRLVVVEVVAAAPTVSHTPPSPELRSRSRPSLRSPSFPIGPHRTFPPF